MDMLQLRPLVVVTGTIHVEGGEKSKVQLVHDKANTPRKKSEQVTVVQHRTVARDRRRANVIVTNYARKLRALRILKTPFGTLIEPTKLKDFKGMLMDIARDVGIFNKGATQCQMTNGLLWENLTGNRLAAMRAWLAQQKRQKNRDVREALPSLRRLSSAA